MPCVTTAEARLTDASAVELERWAERRLRASSQHAVFESCPR